MNFKLEFSRNIQHFSAAMKINRGAKDDSFHFDDYLDTDEEIFNIAHSSIYIHKCELFKSIDLRRRIISCATLIANNKCIFDRLIK